MDWGFTTFVGRDHWPEKRLSIAGTECRSSCKGDGDANFSDAEEYPLIFTAHREKMGDCAQSGKLLGWRAMRH